MLTHDQAIPQSLPCADHLPREILSHLQVIMPSVIFKLASHAFFPRAGYFPGIFNLTGCSEQLGHVWK
jgi:hypothetical protein